MAHARPRAGRIRRHGARCRRAGGCDGRGRVRAGDDAMSEQKHTPGPWTIETRDVPGFTIEPPLGCNGLPVAIVPENRRGNAKAEANARLIAAAPDMLAALHGL